MKTFSILLCVLILACSTDEKAEVVKKNAPPTPDLSTPDKLVKSYWGFEIWGDTTYSMDTAVFKFYSHEVRAKLAAKYADQRAQLRSSHYKLRNNIDKVNIESDSRAVVNAKEILYRNAKDFDEIKYILTKQDNQWLIEDIQQVCWNCKGTGEVLDYLSGYPYRKKTCEYCAGLGWTSRLIPK